MAGPALRNLPPPPVSTDFQFSPISPDLLRVRHHARDGLDDLILSSCCL